jgi:hypothetical protein
MALYEEDMYGTERVKLPAVEKPLGAVARASETLATSDDPDEIRRAYIALQAASIE